ncbi:MAG: hypothetical protein BWY66_02547 [bacterium ADurb.Bin374]|nr:MAG: hypothetical protein BWY66_02547 [bacterium ADurb.Bin374]
MILEKECADALLHQNVEPDRRLVEKQDTGTVQKGNGKLATHALSEREFARLYLETVPDSQHLDQLVASGFELG